MESTEQNIREKHALRVLVVEDSEVNQNLAVAMLNKLGHPAVLGENGVEALKILNQEPFDVILMDCQMPEMDGYETTREIRRQEKAQDVPYEARKYIVAVTAHAMKGDREKCLDAGMDDYISKPVRVGDLKAAFDRYERITDRGDAKPEEDSSFLNFEGKAQLDLLCEELGLETVSELIEDFMAESPKRLQELLKSCAERNMREVQRQAHSLLGICRTYGLNLTNELCVELERAGQESDVTKATHLVGCIDLQLSQDRLMLNRYLRTKASV